MILVIVRFPLYKLRGVPWKYGVGGMVPSTWRERMFAIVRAGFVNTLFGALVGAVISFYYNKIVREYEPVRG